MKRCSEEAYAMCPNRAHCGSIADAVFMEGSECDLFNQQIAARIGYEQVFIRAQIVGQLPSGQKRIQLLATNADGICFYTDERSLIRRYAPSTNADRIRMMNDEELAKVIMCPEGMNDIPYCGKEDVSCVECCLRWLKQPMEEDKLC